jgi:hypothetical protein
MDNGNPLSLEDRMPVCGVKTILDGVGIRLYEGASFSPDRLHNRPEAARYLLTLVTLAVTETHTRYLNLARSSTDYRI